MNNQRLTRWIFALLGFLAGGLQLAAAAEPGVDLLEGVSFTAPKEKGTLEVLPGKFGTAQRFAFENDARSTFFTSNFRGQASWDDAAGISFWVKGDGSSSFAGLEFIYDDDFAVRYDFMFPIGSKDWEKIIVAWDDLIPVLPGEKSRPLDAKSGNKPSKLSALFVGKWWYWQDYPAHSFAIDGFSLEKEIPRTKAEIPQDKPFARLRKKLEKGEPITIVTMGDSLTDFHHWANRKDAWPVLLKTALETKYKSKVTLHNPAIGGTQLRQNLVLMPRWLAEAPDPDLVTVCFGGNDWEAGMREAQFLAANIDAVRRIRRATRGKTEVLMMTSIPSVPQWQTRTELATACRAAAKEQNCGLADTEAAFLLAGKENKEQLFGFDKVHLGPEGHKLVTKTLLDALEGARD